MAFTHLEVHSHFTLLGGTASPAELAARAAADGLTQLALTDTDALYAAVAFARACDKAGVQPITGMAVTVADIPFGPQDRGDPPPVVPAAEAGRLVLLAQNGEGYRSLCRLASLLQSSLAPDPLTGRRALTWDHLRSNRDGLICLSGGQDGWIERYLRGGDRGAAYRYAGRLAGVFGEDACIALCSPAPDSLSREVVAIGQRLGLPVVAVQPVYALDPPGAARLRLLAAIRCNRRLDTVPAEELPPDNGAGLWWQAPAQVAERFSRYPAALAAAGEIASRCTRALPDGRHIWPAIKLLPGETPDQALARQAAAGMVANYGPAPAPPVAERLDAELAAIERHGYAPLFLAVANIVTHAREEQIPVSTRGSVANSLVAYCAGITDVDPIANDLLFERFLSPDRVDPPDIDVDLCSRRRDEVLAYVREEFGADRVALVGTVSTLGLASAVRETAKAYGLSEAEISRLLARIPHVHPRAGPAQVMQALEEFMDETDKPSEAAAGGEGPDVVDGRALPEDTRMRAVLAEARSLVGQPDHMSIHAGGVVITPGPLTDYLPVQLAPKGFLITQYEHGDVEALGLAKIDLLGIRALTVLADAAELVRRYAVPDFRIEDIPFDDRATGDLLERGDTIGVFQCESDGARATLRKLRARTPRDLAIANAFFKPGPSTGGMATHFVRRYRGEEDPDYLHSALEPILAPTKGVLIFQEQVLRIARDLAGLSWGEADHLRRGMGRMRPQEMGQLQERFVAGCQRLPPDGPGLPLDDAQTLWEQVAAFAGFGFNQGHATAYAVVSYRSAYLRAHWPIAFLCARLADFGGFHHPAVYMAEAVRLGFTVRAPHVNYSDAQFTLTAPGAAGSASSGVARPADEAGFTLWMGLEQVRNLRQAAIAAIVRGREERPYAGLRDLLDRVELGAKEVRNLIRCGALEGLPAGRADSEGDGRAASRSELLAEAEPLLGGAVAGRGSRRVSGAHQLAFGFAAPDVEPETPVQRCAWEEEILGLPLTVLVAPLVLLEQQPVSEKLPRYTPLSALFPGSSSPIADPPGARGGAVVTIGLRLPGWTGGPGFLLWDGQVLVTARPPKGLKSPVPWQLLFLRGRVAGDRLETTWLQVDDLRPLSA